MTRFRFVQDHQADYPVKRLCELVECSRSGFYAWRSRPLSDHYLTDVDLAAEIFDIHQASQRTYGAPRVLGQLQHRNRRVGRKRVARIMAECGLVGVHGRRKWRRGKNSSSAAPGPDLIGRDFTAGRSNERWVADIERHEALFNLAMVKGHRLSFVAADEVKLRAARSGERRGGWKQP